MMQRKQRRGNAFAGATDLQPKSSYAPLGPAKAGRSCVLDAHESQSPYRFTRVQRRAAVRLGGLTLGRYLVALVGGVALSGLLLYGLGAAGWIGGAR